MGKQTLNLLAVRCKLTDLNAQNVAKNIRKANAVLDWGGIKKNNAKQINDKVLIIIHNVFIL